jgi:hypothetical protein
LAVGVAVGLRVGLAVGVAVGLAVGMLVGACCGAKDGSYTRVGACCGAKDDGYTRLKKSIDGAGEGDGTPLSSHEIGSQGTSKVIAAKPSVSRGKLQAPQDSMSRSSPT